MRSLELIKAIINIKNDPRYYTFKKVEHEKVLLKRLEDNKIFYNDKIYDQDFFYYHKLEGFMEQIYELRDDYIQENLDELVDPTKPNLRPRERVKEVIRNMRNFIRDCIESLKFWKYRNTIDAPIEPLIQFIKYDPNNCDEITGLVKAQYDVLVKAYKYEFPYELNFDLLDPKKKFKFRNRGENDLDYTSNFLMKDFFYDWFYILGWKSIKPVYQTFAYPFLWHYDDAIYEEMASLGKPMGEEDLVFRNRYRNPFEAGTCFDINWIEEKYDEQKKFNEFDINCKTNSYYTRYKAYNEIYNKDYPEDKKFKTDLIHDFTEEEIQENYENMIDKNKRALDKFNFIMFNEQRRTVVLKFFEELEIMEVSREKLIYDFHWNHEEDSHMWLNKELDIKLYEVFNDPRNLLIMPLIDAYFEVYRSKGYYHQDESFSGPPVWADTGLHKKFMKHLKYFDLSYERQYMFAENMWLIDDYMEIEDVEYDEECEDEYQALALGFGTIIWLAILNFYVLILWFFDFELSYNALNNAVRFAEHLNICVFEKTQVEMRQLVCPEVYYGLELRRPRSRIRTTRVILPFKFYENSYYSYSKKRASNMLPLSILDRLCFVLDEKDFGLRVINRELRLHGQRNLIWKLRIPLIEYPYEWSEADPSPMMRLRRLIRKIRELLSFDKYLEDATDFMRANILPYFWDFNRTYVRPFKISVRASYKIYKHQFIDFCMQIKKSIIDFLKKPTN